MNPKTYHKTLKISFALLLFLVVLVSKAQTIDFGAFKGKPFKIGGGVSAGATFSQSDNDNRDPFVYTFTGNLGISFYSFTMPISYNFSNTGSQLDYKIPFNFNRLSISPKYKWITAHIGDVSMTFSPYTLNGHQFSGAGIELTPTGPLKFSAMTGRLLKAVEDDGNPNTIPGFKRMGYGTKLGFEKPKYKVGLITFYAKDDIHSIANVPDAKNVTPKENLVVGLTAEGQIEKNTKLSMEYSNSALTQDLRAEDISSKKGMAGQFLNTKSSTQNFSALKLGIDFKLEKAILGVSYERIDPNYQTLGSYFFSNDLENIMVNASRPFFKDKLSMTLNVGMQKDNLDNKKEATTAGLVGSITASAKINEQLVTNISYSNQTMTTNTNPDQFFQINQIHPEQNNLDQLNFRQLSQNAAVNANYNFKKAEIMKKSLIFNYSFNQVANEQGGIVRLGQLSSFHNFNTAFNIGILKTQWNFITALNYTINTIGEENSSTIGPNFGASKKFLKDKLNTQLSTGYNVAQGKTSQNNNFNFRLNGNYIYKDNHNFILTITQVSRKGTNQSQRTSNTNEFIATIGYSYNFSAKKTKVENGATTVSEHTKKQQSPTYIKTKFNTIPIEGEPDKIWTLVFDSIIKTGQSINPTIDQFINTEKEALQLKTIQLQNTQNKDSIKQILNSFKTGLVNVDTKWQEFLRFDIQYQQVFDLAFIKLKEDVEQTNVNYDNYYFIKKYDLEENSTLTITNIEQQIKLKQIVLSVKDKGRLAHINLVNTLMESTSEVDFFNRPEMKQLLIANKEEYYQAFLQKVKEPALLKKAEIQIADYYLKDYLKQFD